MKRILVPTDFSEISNIALQYAVAMNNSIHGHLDVIHTYTVVSRTDMIISMEPVIRQTAEEDMDKLMAGIVPMVLKDASIGSEVVKGDPVDVIGRMSKKNQYDLIIMGTQGSSGILEVFIGSTTLAVMRQTETPLLAVPREGEYRPVKNIVFAIDSVGLSKDQYEPLRDIAKMFDSQIYVFHVAENPDDMKYPADLDVYLADCTYSYHSTVHDDVFGSINRFSKDVGADLIAMIRRDKGFFKRLSQPSQTKRELFHSEIPLLIFHAKQ